MEEKHNPYTPTRAPLFPEERPLSEAGSEFEESAEYGGFWRRFGAQFVDGLIVLPLTVLVFVGLSFTKNFYLYWFVPGLAFGAFYSIYLVRRFGGTPGKRILGMRIAMVNGAPVTARAAILRYSVTFILSALSALAMIFAAYRLADENFYPLGYLQKMTTLQGAAPAWNAWVTGAMYVWFLGLAIVMLCNRKRRALHDFIAGTVVLREH